ncbi:MAG: hypothetical protein ACI90E_002683 [Yoonia sp.]|jgi:hypothetical protein
MRERGYLYLRILQRVYPFKASELTALIHRQTGLCVA